jgi:hypothetical protein
VQEAIGILFLIYLHFRDEFVSTKPSSFQGHGTAVTKLTIMLYKCKLELIDAKLRCVLRPRNAMRVVNVKSNQV